MPVRSCSCGNIVDNHTHPCPLCGAAPDLEQGRTYSPAQFQTEPRDTRKTGKISRGIIAAASCAVILLLAAAGVTAFYVSASGSSQNGIAAAVVPDDAVPNTPEELVTDPRQSRGLDFVNRSKRLKTLSR